MEPAAAAALPPSWVGGGGPPFQVTQRAPGRCLSRAGSGGGAAPLPVPSRRRFPGRFPGDSVSFRLRTLGRSRVLGSARGRTPSRVRLGLRLRKGRNASGRVGSFLLNTRFPFWLKTKAKLFRTLSGNSVGSAGVLRCPAFVIRNSLSRQPQPNVELSPALRMPPPLEAFGGHRSPEGGWVAGVQSIPLAPPPICFIKRSCTDTTARSSHAAISEEGPDGVHFPSVFVCGSCY